MKKIIALILLLLLAVSVMLYACGDAEPNDDSNVSPSAVDTPSESDEEAYEITYTNARTWTNSIGSFWVQTIIEVTNTGTAPLYLSSGSYDLETVSGSLVESRTLVSVFPDVIDPGEKAYYYEETSLDNDPGEELVVYPHVDIEAAKIKNIRFPLSDVELRDEQYGGIEAIGRIENTNPEAAEMVYIAVVLYDANNIPIGLIFTITDEIAAGEKIGFSASELSLPDDIKAASVAHFEAFAYPMQMQF